jgi:hypothetical protein
MAEAAPGQYLVVWKDRDYATGKMLPAKNQDWVLWRKAPAGQPNKAPEVKSSPQQRRRGAIRQSADNIQEVTP